MRAHVWLQILDHLNIPAEHIQAALDAMVEDSQQESPFSRDTLKDCTPWTRDEETVQVCNDLLKQFNLPDFDQKFRFNSNYEIELLY